MILTETGMNAIVDAIYECNPLSVDLLLFCELNLLLDSTGSASEKFRSFEVHFNPRPTKVNFLTFNTASVEPEMRPDFQTTQ